MSTPTALQPSVLPMAEAFFAQALTSHSLSHAYILKGKAYGAMYQLALAVARVLNCQNRPQPAETPASLDELACGTCTQCRWVRQNAHPAVISISRLTYQVSDKGQDLSPEDLNKLARKASHPTQIKAEQIERLLHQLGLSSEHNRVVIFTDAEELPAGMPSEATPPFEWANLEANADKSFHIRPLERRLFNHASANRFLKTLEEPPPRTLFFFVAETEEQLLETIVSRCQVVPCSPGMAAEPGAVDVSESYRTFLDGVLQRLGQDPDIYALAGEFEQVLLVEAGLDAEQALTLLQSHLRAAFHQTPWDAQAFALYRARQEAITTTIRRLHAKTHSGQSLVQLFLTLAGQDGQ